MNPNPNPNPNRNLIEEAKQIQQTYKKPFFFKKKTKIECAKNVSNTMNLEELLFHTSFQIPNTNIIYIDYTIFKLYANEDNYIHIIHTILGLITHCISTYGNYIIHINFDSFTISAFERYKEMFFLLISTIGDMEVYPYMTQCYIYYSPSTIMQMIQFITSVIKINIKEKITLYNKEESKSLLDQLFTSFDNR
jgi:hypothetical protein